MLIQTLKNPLIVLIILIFFCLGASTLTAQSNGSDVTNGRGQKMKDVFSTSISNSEKPSSSIEASHQVKTSEPISSRAAKALNDRSSTVLGRRKSAEDLRNE